MRIIEKAVTLDLPSDGRLDLGVGRGASLAELAFRGLSDQVRRKAGSTRPSR